MEKRIDALNERGFGLRNTSRAQALKLATRAKALSEKIQYPRGIAFAMRTICIAEGGRDPRRGLLLAIQGEQAALEAHEPVLAAGCLVVQNYCLDAIGEIGQGVACLTKAAELASEAKDYSTLCLVKHNLGAASYGHKDYAGAESFYTQAIDLSELHGAKTYRFMSQCALGETLLKLNKPEGAIPFLLEGIAEAVERGFHYLAAEAYTWLASAYRLKNQFDLSLEALVRAKEEGRKSSRNTSLHHAWFGMGVHHHEAGEAALALKWLRRALKHAAKIGYKSGLSQSHEYIAKIQAERGRHREAYASLLAHMAVEREIADEKSQSRMQALQVIHETEVMRAKADAAETRSAELQLLNQELERALAARDEAHRHLENMAATDELTHVLSRREFIRRATRELESARATGQTFAVLFLDIDHFKSVNDTFGHQVGDVVLRRFATVVKRVLRSRDTFGRIGGEEFALSVANSTPPKLRALAERVLDSVRGIELEDTAPGRKITASIGIGFLRSEVHTLSDFMKAADDALYRAKQMGRDRSEFFEPAAAKAA